MNRILATIGVTGFYWAFAAFGWANVTDKYAPTLDGMWWGFLAMAVAGWIYTLKMIWEPL